MNIHPTVVSALEAGRGIVAFESTIIAHGMPYPDNFETGVAMEQAAAEQVRVATFLPI